MIEVWIGGFLLGIGITLMIIASFIKVRRPWR